MAFSYPVTLSLEGRRCVVLGGGAVGEQKIHPLLHAGARVVVISETFTEGLTRLARRGEVELIHRAYSPGDLAGAFLAIAATDDPEVNAQAYAEAEERNVLLNAVDDNDHCHFAVPSIIRRGDFLLAMSTGGKAPALAKRLRMQLTDAFGPEYGELVDLLGRVRDDTIGHLRPQLTFEEWAARWQQALDHDLLGLLHAGRTAEAEALVRETLEGGGRDAGHTPGPPPTQRPAPEPPEHCGGVCIVGAGPGDPGLITVRGREALEACDIVVHDRLVHPDLLDGKETMFVGKEAGDHPVPQQEINDLLVTLALGGRRVVRLKGGDPFVFGRGAEEAEALARAGIPFEVVPAPTSAVAALAYAGIPVTDRRAGSSVTFITGHDTESVDWDGIARSADTLVVFMGLAKLGEISARLIAAGRDPETPAAAVENGTLPEQRTIVSDLRDLHAATVAAGVASPALVVVGEVVRLREGIAWLTEEAPEAVGAGFGGPGHTDA